MAMARPRFLPQVEELESLCVPAVFGVNSLDDTQDANLGDGFAADVMGNTTLRAAIEEGNALAGADSIIFNLLAGPQTVTLGKALPIITAAGGAISIDGTTQPGYDPAHIPLVMISCAGADIGIHIQAGGSTIKGLGIVGYGTAGIFLDGGKDNHVYNNLIGIDRDGKVNGESDGIDILDSMNNEIGSVTFADFNVISGAEGTGISIRGTSSGNAVHNNLIGTNLIGSAR